MKKLFFVLLVTIILTPICRNAQDYRKEELNDIPHINFYLSF